MPSVFVLRVVMLTDNVLCIVMLSVAKLRLVIILSVVLLSINIMSAVQLCHFAERCYAESFY